MTIFFNGPLDGFTSGEASKGRVAGTINASGVELASTPTRTSEILSIKVIPTREEILQSVIPDRTIFNEIEDAEIRRIYNGNRHGVTYALAEELCENLRDEEGKRTPHFRELIKLGLLDDRDTYQFAGAETHPVGGYRLLTPKGANFLRIDLGKFTVCGEIKTLREKTQKEVASLIEHRDTQTKILTFFAEIISHEPKLSEICPPNSNITYVLREMMATLSAYINNTKESLLSANSKKHWEDMETLGWISPSGSKDATMSMLLTPKGGKVFRDYNNLLLSLK